MIRRLRWSALILSLALAPVLRADDKPASPWAVDRALQVSPQGAPEPALKYRLLPPVWELKDGNAVPIYLRLVHEQNDAARKYWTETPVPWNLLPVSKMPLDDARKFLHDYHYRLRQFEIGAHRRRAEWDYTLDEPNPIGLLLPDVQVMRSYAPMLVLQARVAIADGDYTAAARHLETGFGFCRHVAEGPTLIHSLVAIAMMSQFTNTVADLVERPGAPNLYWALTAMPRPLVDLEHGLAFEYQTAEKQFPELGELDRERTAQQWDGVLRRLRTDLQELAIVPLEGGKRKLPDWFPKDSAPGDSAANSPELTAALTFVARRGLSPEKVEAMPPAQVLLLYIMGTYQNDRDDWFRAAYLPYPQALPLWDAADKRLGQTPTSEGHVLGRLLLPAMNRVMSAQAQLERRLAALQTIEALRMYSAAHKGKLPDKLNEVTEVPLPNDPGTGRPFEYSLEGDTATLVSLIAGDPQPHNGLRYRVTIRKN
jgi:hypothetical protein